MRSNDMVEMKVENLVVDPMTKTPIIILKDTSGEKSLPIWIGYPEATAIALYLENVATPRPMTHDLIKNILSSAEISVEYICVNDLKDNTFFAVISLKTIDGSVEIDSRPSDAIAVALRLQAPIYVSQKVLDNAKEIDVSPASEGASEDDQLKKWLEQIKPSDFGKLDQ